MVRDSDATLGRSMWHMLHTIAVNFPDGKGEGLTTQRLKGYFEFFKSLQHVLPREAWRDSWRMVTGVGDGELTWEAFQTLRSHKKLSKWLFFVHDEVRKSMRRPMQGPSEPVKRYLHYLKKYEPYRTGTNGRNDTNSTDEAGTKQIKNMLARRVSVLDKFMGKKYPDYKTWPVARQYRTRIRDIDEAARWFWANTRNTLSQNASWNRKNALKQRQDIVAKFDEEHRRAHRRVLNWGKAALIFGRNSIGV
jgi:hypothetical protein